MISAVLIVRNEAARIEACLAALQPIVDEIVVLDTGSTDRTLPLAQAYTDRVFSAAWTNDFAAARNAAIAHARHPWILSIDADECVEGGANAGSQLRAFTETQPPSTLGSITIHNIDDGSGLFEETLDHAARVFHKDHYHFAGAIHEQLVTRVSSKPAPPRLVVSTGLHAVHTGYAQQPTDPAHKSRRNIPLLTAELATRPDDEYAYFQLGKAHYALREYALAADAFRAALSCMHFAGPVLPLGRLGAVARPVLTACLGNLAYALVNLGRAEEATKVLEEHAAIGHPAVHWADFAHVRGYVYLMLGELKPSRAAYESSLALGPTREDVLGTGSFGSLYHLGLLDEAEGRLVRAADHYVAALDLRPAYRPVLARAIDWLLEGQPGEGAALLARGDTAAATRAYIDRITHCLQNDAPDDARRLIGMAAQLGPDFRGALDAWTAAQRSEPTPNDGAPLP